MKKQQNKEEAQKKVSDTEDTLRSESPDTVEYHEVLHSDRSNTVYSKRKTAHKMLFTDVNRVESDIDNIDKKSSAANGNIEKKVDNLLFKKKDKLKKSSSRKPANVIYVVSKPQPGQVKGDWAVRSHHKIFSHHRTKQAAIKKARSVAIDKDATVLVQNTDGTFSNGFKPRTKKK
jgi:hypothetical protein